MQRESEMPHKFFPRYLLRLDAREEPTAARICVGLTNKNEKAIFLVEMALWS
jgi:hypothetical protein